MGNTGPTLAKRSGLGLRIFVMLTEVTVAIWEYGKGSRESTQGKGSRQKTEPGELHTFRRLVDKNRKRGRS